LSSVVVVVGGLSFLSTLACSLSELGDGADDPTKALAEVFKVLLALINVRVVLLAEIVVLVEENLGNFVHGICEIKELGLEVHNHVVDGAVVLLVKAETGHFKSELVEAASLGHVETDHVEFAN